MLELTKDSAKQKKSEYRFPSPLVSRNTIDIHVKFFFDIIICQIQSHLRSMPCSRDPGPRSARRTISGLLFLLLFLLSLSPFSCYFAKAPSFLPSFVPPFFSCCFTFQGEGDDFFGTKKGGKEEADNSSRGRGRKSKELEGVEEEEAPLSGFCLVLQVSQRGRDFSKKGKGKVEKLNFPGISQSFSCHGI